MFQKLKERWKVKSINDVVIILIVFALTGTSIMLLRRLLVAHFEWAESKWFTYTYYWAIIPFYNVVLLAYGYIFGKFNFFWEFEKRTMKRIRNLFVRKST